MRSLTNHRNFTENSKYIYNNILYTTNRLYPAKSQRCIKTVPRTAAITQRVKNQR